MGKSRDALGIVLAGLRELLAAGAIAPGAVISIGDLALSYRVSVTPVREALSRLAGEGILRATRRLGYERPDLEPEDLRQLYDFRESLLLGAVRLAPPSGPPATPESFEGGQGAARLFEAVIAEAGNAPLAKAYATTALLLAPAVALEPRLFDDLRSERAVLAAAHRDRNTGAFETDLRVHHRRRRAAANRLIELLHASAEGSARAQPR